MEGYVVNRGRRGKREELKGRFCNILFDDDESTVQKNFVLTDPRVAVLAMKGLAVVNQSD